MAAGTLSKLNATAAAYEDANKKRVQGKGWSVGKPKDVKDFSKGASESGSMSWDNLKKAFK
jgi:hypothetical protein